MGNLINPENNWWEPLARVPDGSYALFRSNENTVEVISDIVGSRTIWYIQTEDMLIASTSQRAIVHFLQDFKPNKFAYSWMLSSGTLGPGLAWDFRIKCIGGNSCLILDRSSWKLTIKKESANFEPTNLSDKEHEIQLKSALDYVFKHLKLDYSKWLLPLSGGFDSRALLLMLKDQKNLKCITWGFRSSLTDKKNDAYIAKSLAKYFNLEHKFFEIDTSNEPIEVIFNRFLVAGEGRIDHISGYMDGFRIWKHIYEFGYQGIIRGDETFGNRAVITSYDVYRNMGFLTLTDYENLKPIKEVIKGYDQSRPAFLERGENESMEHWRDRINAEFEVPMNFAALSDLKLAYVEVINPFLCRRIVQQVRTLPDHLRTGKSLFKKIVTSMSPKIEFAKRAAIEPSKDVLKTQKVVNLISNELSTNYARALLSERLIEFILENIEVSSDLSKKSENSLRVLIKHLIPKSLKNILRNTVMKRYINYNILAFRAYIICKMNQILSSDAVALHQDR